MSPGVSEKTSLKMQIKNMNQKVILIHKYANSSILTIKIK